MLIVRGRTLIDNAVSQVNVLCRHPEVRDEHNTKSEVQYLLNWED